MPVPLPGDDTVLLVPPDAAEAAFVARGVVAAVAPATGLTALQDVLLRAFFESMTTHVIDPAAATPIGAAEFAAGLAAAARTQALADGREYVPWRPDPARR